MASQDVNMTSTTCILVTKKYITEPIDSTMPLNDFIDVEPVHSHSMIVSLWVVKLCSSVTSKMDHLEYVIRIVQLNPPPLKENLPSIISQYQKMLSEPAVSI